MAKEAVCKVCETDSPHLTASLCHFYSVNRKRFSGCNSWNRAKISQMKLLEGWFGSYKVSSFLTQLQFCCHQLGLEYLNHHQGPR